MQQGARPPPGGGGGMGLRGNQAALRGKQAAKMKNRAMLARMMAMRMPEASGGGASGSGPGSGSNFMNLQGAKGLEQKTQGSGTTQSMGPIGLGAPAAPRASGLPPVHWCCRRNKTDESERLRRANEYVMGEEADAYAYMILLTHVDVRLRCVEVDSKIKYN